MSIDWDRIERFIGFGRAGAPVVFIGMEEGLQRDADLIADLELRSTYEPYVDLMEAQGDLGEASKFFGPAAVTQRTWRPMCHLMLRRDGVSTPTNVQRVRYQAERLGRRDGETLLAELLPYPHSSTDQWLYERFGHYATRSDYEAKMIPRRVELLRQALLGRGVELVVSYGKAHWDHFKAIVGSAQWNSIGPFEVAQIGAQRVVLSPHFSGRDFNTEEELNRFADIALGRAVEAGREDAALSDTGVDNGMSFDATDDPIRSANRDFRKAFAQLAKAYRAASGLSPQAISDAVTPRAGQGNPAGVMSLERSNGWVNPRFATEVFRELGIPNPEAFGRAYADLKAAVDGQTTDRD